MTAFPTPQTAYYKCKAIKGKTDVIKEASEGAEHRRRKFQHEFCVPLQLPPYWSALIDAVYDI